MIKQEQLLVLQVAAEAGTVEVVTILIMILIEHMVVLEAQDMFTQLPIH